MHVYLHIGYPKTGSSAIQSHLATNRAWLGRSGLYIPATGYNAGAGHVYILPTIVHGQSSFDADESTGKLRDELREAREKGFKKVLISSEGFAVAPDEYIRRLASALRDCSVTILAYLREQGEQFQSGVLQHVERLRTAQASALFERDKLLTEFDDSYDYATTLTRWRDCFDGQSDIRTRLFVRDRLKNGNIVMDFLNWLDLAPDEEFCLQSSHVNVSLDVQCGALLYLCKENQQRLASLVPLSRALTSLMAHHGSAGKDFLTSRERQEVREHFFASNERLFREFRPEKAAQDETQFASPSINESRPPRTTCRGRAPQPPWTAIRKTYS